MYYGSREESRIGVALVVGILGLFRIVRLKGLDDFFRGLSSQVQRSRLSLANYLLGLVGDNCNAEGSLGVLA
jgi:hypothetical protein